MNLPSPIQAYFDADRRRDADALAQAFAPGAVVVDEGHSYGGREAIAAWWRAAQDQYQPVTELLSTDAAGEATQVRARVSGTFPGSPITLTFQFQVSAGEIARLEVHP